MSRQDPEPTELQASSPKLTAWRALMTTYGSVTPRLDEELRAVTELDLRSYDTLLHTFEAGNAGIRMAELAKRVVMSKSGLTALVDKLEQAGLLRRLPDPDDRRATRISITDAGLDAFKSAAKFHLAGIARHFADKITISDAEALTEILQRVIEVEEPDTQHGTTPGHQRGH